MTDTTTNIVTAIWINSQMIKHNIRIKDIADQTGINKTNLSSWIGGVRPMSKPVKAMFYYFFENKKARAAN